MTTLNIKNGKRKIEITEEGGIKDQGLHREQGDTYWELEDKAARFIELGWAKCVDTGEQGERKPGANGKITPASTNTTANV